MSSRAQKLSPGAGAGHRQAQQGIRRRVGASTKRAGEPTVTTPALLEELHQRKQALKQSAATPEERATIEIVALLFQSILTEDRIPASGARVVRAAADAGAARGRHRARLLCHRRPPGAAADRPHGRLRDGLRQLHAQRRRRAGKGDQARGAGGRGLSRHRPARLPDRAHRVREVPRALLQHRERGHAQGRVAGAAGRAARDHGHPVHHRAAPHAQRDAGAGKRARLPVPGLGRRAGHHRGALRRAERRDRAR